MAATAISSATTTRTNATLLAADNFPLGTGGKGKIAASETLEGIARVCDDKAGVRTELDLPTATATTAALALKAPLASPTFTGTVAMPTAAAGTNTTQGATTAFAQSTRATNSEVSGYAARVEAAGGFVDSYTLGKLDLFVTDVKKVSGLWAKVKEAYPFVGDGLTAALVKLVYQGAVSTITNTNLVAADYSQAVGMGPLTDHSSKVLDTGFVGSSYGISKASFGLIVSLPSRSYVYNGSLGHSVGLDASPNTDHPDAYVDYFSVGMVSVLSQSGGAIPGHTVAIVGDGTAQRIYFDGLATKYNTATHTGGFGTAFKFFGMVSQSATRYQNGPVGMTVITTGLTETEAKYLCAAVQRFEKSVRSFYAEQDGLIAFGDSIMAGQGVTAYANAMPERVARFMGKRLVNYGNHTSRLTSLGANEYSGELMVDALYAARPYPSERTVIISYGTNDGNASVSDTTYETDLTTVVDQLLAAQCKVIIASPCYSYSTTYATTYMRPYAVKCAAVAVLRNVMFCDMNRAIGDLADPTTGMADTLHPNDTGHLANANCVIARLQGRNQRTVSLNFGSISAGATEDITVEILTARTGQPVSLSLPTAIEAGLVLNAWVSANDTVTVRASNISGSPINAAAAYFTVAVHQ